MNQFMAIRMRDIASEFSRLDAQNNTDPDRIGTRILRILISVLVLPLTTICRRLLSEGS